MKTDTSRELEMKVLISICIFLAGAVTGVISMFFVHKDALTHYNVCQENDLQTELIEANARLKEANDIMSHSFTIGEAKGIIRRKKK